MSGDFIRRESLGLTDFEIIMCDGDYKEGLKLLLEKIENAPAADVVEVLHGRWEQVGSIIPMYECNQCHSFSLGGNFCPNCGAKMDGG